MELTIVVSISFLSAFRPDVAKSRDPYSMWTGFVCGHAHAPSVAHATDVVIQAVSRYRNSGRGSKDHFFLAFFHTNYYEQLK